MMLIPLLTVATGVPATIDTTYRQGLPINAVLHHH